jgi:hypothetical protein
MLILKRATSHLGFSRWRLSKRRSPALMGRKANDHELSLGETRRETILNPLEAKPVEIAQGPPVTRPHRFIATRHNGIAWLLVKALRKRSWQERMFPPQRSELNNVPLRWLLTEMKR